MKKKRFLQLNSCLGLLKTDRNCHLTDNFFDDPQPQDGEGQTETPVEDVKVKVGEKEYDQDTLQKLVGLGEIGLEAEQKFKTRIDRVWPQFQSIINEKKELEEKLATFEAEKKAQHDKELEERMKQFEGGKTTPSDKNGEESTPQQFTKEQIREIALKQAEELGIGPEAMKKTVMEVLQGQQLIKDISDVIDDMTTEGLPTATVDDIINHMQETGIKNPTRAYKDLFEKEYLEKQAEKIASIKRGPGLPTVQQSTAGAKVPPNSPNFRRMKDDDLSKLVNEMLQEASG